MERPPQHHQGPSQIQDAVMDRIKEQAVTPTPRWRFQCFEWAMWALWLLSVVIGSVAVSIILYTGTHSFYALFEATHESFFSFWVEVLPYAWLLTFALMGGVAYWNFRRTKRGYRYSVGFVVGTSVAASLLGGAGLHAAGAGAVIDRTLGDRMAMYVSLEEKELAMWQMPAEGRLVGYGRGEIASSSFVSFTDHKGQAWKLNTVELSEMDRQLLATGKEVRVVGIASTTAADCIRACGVFPWMYDEAPGMAQLNAERSAFIERMYAHKDGIAERRNALVDAVATEAAETDPDGQCAKLSVVERIGNAM